MKINISNHSDSLILMIHGFSGYPRNLEYLAEKINNMLGYDILVPRLPGHNKTLDDLKESSHEDWVFAIDKILKEKNSKYKNIYLIGFSMGTLIATMLADRYENIRKMILIAPPFSFPFKKKFLLFLSPILKYIKKYHYKDIGEKKMNRNINDPEMRKKYPVKFEKEPLESVIEFNRLRKKAKKRFKKNKTPFLIIQSVKDRVATFDENNSFLKSNMGPTYGKFVILNESGHMIPIDFERDEVVEETINFIKEDLSWKKI